jgi:hypothetical protein
MVRCADGSAKRMTAGASVLSARFINPFLMRAALAA